jgi:hypothetical protein
MITIQKGGNISMNLAAFEMLGGSADVEEMLVELLYNRENRVIGIRRSSGSPHEYPLRKQSNSLNFIVAGRAFTKHYGINTDQARRYIGKLSNDVMMLDLDGEHITVSRKVSR